MSIVISMSFMVLIHTSSSTLKMSPGLVQQKMKYTSIEISMSFLVLIHTSTSTLKISPGLVHQENEIYEHLNQHVFRGTN